MIDKFYKFKSWHFSECGSKNCQFTFFCWTTHILTARLHRWDKRCSLASVTSVSLYNFCLIISFGYPCWVSANKSNLIDCAQNISASDCLFSFCNLRSDWLHFKHFNCKIKLICRLCKRGDQARSSIFTNLKFSALVFINLLDWASECILDTVPR